MVVKFFSPILHSFQNSFGRMWLSSRKWARNVSVVACLLYFFVIITQIPLFRFPCRIGMCETPVEITACQLIASESLPTVVIKAILYPGAIRKSFMKGSTIPSHNEILNSFKSNMRNGPATTDLKHMEVVAGSYFSVAGAILGLLKGGRMSLFGLCLIIWGVAMEILAGKRVAINTNMLISLVLAICSVRRDVRKLIRSFKSKHVAVLIEFQVQACRSTNVRKLKNYSKSKSN